MKYYELSFQKNIRDIGGLKGYNGRTIKYGRIYRGGSLHKYVEEDRKILDSFHLTDIVDFRTSSEHKNQPDILLDGVTYHNCATFENSLEKEQKHVDDGNLLWFVNEGDTGHNHLVRTYKELIDTEEGQKAYRKFFEILLKDDKRVIYFHCSQGKDRAGLAAYLLESGLGVSFEDIKQDYLLSNKAMELRVQRMIERVKDKEFYDDQYRQSLLDVFSAKMEYLQEAIDIINEKYGGVLSYLTDVLNVDIDLLRKTYLK